MFGFMDTHPEIQVTGHILHNPEGVHRCIEAGIEPGYFETKLGRALWEAITKVHADGRETNFPNVGMQIPVELRAEFADASLNFPISTNLEYHLEKFLNHAAKARAKHIATHGPLDPVENAKQVHSAMEEITSGLNPQDTIRDQIEQWTHHKEASLSGKQTGLQTHIKALNEFMPKGFSPGALYVLAARPGDGKTTIAINFASHCVQKARVGFATIEMPAVEIIDRIVALRSRVPYGKTDLTEAEGNRTMQAARTLATQTELDIWDKWQGRWDKLEALITRAMRERKPPKLIIIDHLALMKFDSKTRDSVSNLSEITGAIKRFAVSNQVAILLCSQMNRSIEQDNGRPPRLSDLRGSGTIEQDADVVMFLHKDLKTEQRQLRIAKNRHGQAHVALPLQTNFAISEMKGDEL